MTKVRAETLEELVNELDDVNAGRALSRKLSTSARVHRFVALGEAPAQFAGDDLEAGTGIGGRSGAGATVVDRFGV